MIASRIDLFSIWRKRKSASLLETPRCVTTAATLIFRFAFSRINSSPRLTSATAGGSLQVEDRSVMQDVIIFVFALERAFPDISFESVFAASNPSDSKSGLTLEMGGLALPHRYSSSSTPSIDMQEGTLILASWQAFRTWMAHVSLAHKMAVGLCSECSHWIKSVSLFVILCRKTRNLCLLPAIVF